MKIKMRKRLSAPGLLEAVRLRAERIKDPLLGKTRYPLGNCVMSALAMFSLKYRSLLQFDDSQRDKRVSHNLGTLYGVDEVPSDTYMRERLDTVDPSCLRRCFKACFSAVQRGKELLRFKFLDDYVLVSNDGTGFFYSDAVHCDNCCERHHQDGSVSYYHQMMCAVLVHPDESVVLPMTAEAILKQDGNSKNDCERNASQRLLANLRSMHPKLNMVIVEDGLHSNGPHIRHLKSLNYRYIIGVKPADHTYLFDWIKDCTERVTLQRDGKTYELSWFNDAPLNASNEDVRVNFIECIETSAKGRTQRFSWVTDFKVTRENVYQLMKGGRARWKIENETFNTLKTQGYHFEHNFGHGYQHLSTVLSQLMLLAFLIDQIQQMSCPAFAKALAKAKSKMLLWEYIRSWFFTVLVDSWHCLFSAIVEPPDIRLRVDTS